MSADCWMLHGYLRMYTCAAMNSLTSALLTVSLNNEGDCECVKDTCKSMTIPFQWHKPRLFLSAVENSANYELNELLKHRAHTQISDLFNNRCICRLWSLSSSRSSITTRCPLLSAACDGVDALHYWSVTPLIRSLRSCTSLLVYKYKSYGFQLHLFSDCSCSTQ